MAVLSKVANIAVQPQPVGVVEAFAGSNAPNGWLICDGSQVSRALFPELFSVIGTTYGSGDGFSTFTLPDLRGRTIAGRDGVNNMNNGPTNRLTSTHFGASGTALGNSGGIESHTLTTAQLPAHAHDVRSNIFGTENSVPVGDGRAQPSTTSGWTWSVAGNAAANHLYTKNTGSGAAHNITQPTMILNYIIKAVSELPRGGWYNSSSPDLVTSLPTNPYNGQEVYLQSSSSSVQVLKRYNGSQWISVSMPTGTIIQTVHGFTSTQVSLATSTYSSIGLSASITPRFSDSKILLLSSVQYRRMNWDNGFGLSLSRNGSTIYTPGSRYYRYQYEVSGGNDGGAVPFYYEDSPNSTSSLTYAILAATYNGTVDFQDDNHYRSTIILMEVAA